MIGGVCCPPAAQWPPPACPSAVFFICGVFRASCSVQAVPVCGGGGLLLIPGPPAPWPGSALSSPSALGSQGSGLALGLYGFSCEVWPLVLTLNRNPSTGAESRAALGYAWTARSGSFSCWDPNQPGSFVRWGGHSGAPQRLLITDAGDVQPLLSKEASLPLPEWEAPLEPRCLLRCLLVGCLMRCTGPL